MRVLYIGVYRDGTGWANSAIHYMLALDAAGIDVVARPVKLNGNQPEIPEKIQAFERKSAAGCDYVIQHMLPHMMDYNGHFKKNIALFFTETDSFPDTIWANHLNFMSEGWVANTHQITAAKKSGVKIPLKVVPIPSDIDKFSKGYEPLPGLKYRLGGNFAFYTIGEFNKRKNFEALLHAFHTEFHPNEPVSLVIKSTKPGMNPGQCHMHIHQFCESFRNGLKTVMKQAFYKQEIIISDNFTNDQMMQLHATCDCFVQPSFGEAWSIPAFDAMAMGKTPIVTDSSGYKHYINESNGWLVKSNKAPCHGNMETFNDLYTGREYWDAVCVESLRKAMREAYENEVIRKNKAKKGIEHASNFSYSKIGNVMRENLNVEKTKQ